MIPTHMLARLDAAIRAAGVAITGVDSNGNVTPANLQSAAQATINAFDVSEATHAAWETALEPLLADLLAQATGAVNTNNTFIGVGSPSNAQVIAHVKALSQQNNRIIRGLFRVIQLTWRNGQTPP